MKTLILFGSTARGTENPKSDIDLLAVGGDSNTRPYKNDNIEIHHYTEDYFFNLAHSGSLFGAHIAYEGVAIFDPRAIFVRFRESFRPKKSYSVEIQHALDLAEFLGKYRVRFKNQNLAAKRVAWCVRTVLISTLAERGQYVFSPEGLSSEFEYRWVPNLISLRRNGAGRIRAAEVQRFLKHFDRPTETKMTRQEFLDHFFETDNSIALATIESLDNVKSVDNYA